MNLVSRLLQLHTPAAAKQKMLDELFVATTNAFDEALPDTDRKPFDERLERYAEYTRDAVARATSEDRDLAAIERRLYVNAYELGRNLRGLLGVDESDTAEVMNVGRTLYKSIGIDLRGTADGDVTVSDCYFSRFYTPETCRVISALDAGLFAGLSGGGSFIFLQRITEGHRCCRARFTAREGST